MTGHGQPPGTLGISDLSLRGACSRRSKAEAPFGKLPAGCHVISRGSLLEEVLSAQPYLLSSPVKSSTPPRYLHWGTSFLIGAVCDASAICIAGPSLQLSFWQVTVAGQRTPFLRSGLKHTVRTIYSSTHASLHCPKRARHHNASKERVRVALVPLQILQLTWCNDAPLFQEELKALRLSILRMEHVAISI